MTRSCSRVSSTHPPSTACCRCMVHNLTAEGVAADAVCLRLSPCTCQGVASRCHQCGARRAGCRAARARSFMATALRTPSAALEWRAKAQVTWCYEDAGGQGTPRARRNRILNRRPSNNGRPALWHHRRG